MNTSVNEEQKNETTTNVQTDVKSKDGFQEVNPGNKQVRTDSYFDGSLIELIGWKILSYLITTITLGIGAAWGQCMLYSYQIKHTVYNGKRLKFEGTGGDLFVNIFKWILLTIITLGIYAFFIPVKKTKWVISNIHFEDEQFIKEECYFDGKTIQLIGVNLLCNFLTYISFGLLYPFTVCYKLRWINKHTVINRKKIAFNGRAISLFGKYMLWCFLTLITFGIYGLWLPIKMLKWQTKHTHIKTVNEVEEKDKSLLIAIPIAIVAVVVAVCVILPIATDKIQNFDAEESMENFEDFNFKDIFTNKNSKSNNESSKSGAGTVVLPVESQNPSEVPSKNVNPGVSSSKTTNSEQPTNTTNSNTKTVAEPTTSNGSSTQSKGAYPTEQEIAGKYNANIKKEVLVNGLVDESQTKKTNETIEFTNNNGKITYNGKYELIYQSNTGYGWYADGTNTVEVYFTYKGNQIDADIRVYEQNNTIEYTIQAVK